MKNGIIRKVSGPLVVATSMTGARMFDVVRVGEMGLVGEIIEISGDSASVQVYEETAGIGPGENIRTTGMPLSVELGPGLIESIFDGIQRPLDRIRERSGDFITRGIDVPALSRERRWHFVPSCGDGDSVTGGQVIGTVNETSLVVHRIMLRPGLEGVIRNISEGDFTVTDDVAAVETDAGIEAVKLMQVWPVRVPRPFRKKLSPVEPLVTGQRVIDTFFPVAKGGTACIPGPFGSGKTVVQHQLAKWSDADIVVYIGCGERGNEMTDVLREFPELKDPRTGESLMKRTVLIANTSNMPVAAREASVYTGITIAEYFRDMGYSVALMADSTSRWAEAMREISGRLEEMPGDEGYPAYLGTRVAEFYERAGRVICLGEEEREGTLTVIGAVSPAGGDLSDPVVQATLRVVKVFWSLEDTLAFQRHFPAISWLRSYTLYNDIMNRYYSQKVGDNFPSLRLEALRILERESELMEIVRLVGEDSLSAPERLVLKTARIIREDFLLQNAFHEKDGYTGIEKQSSMLSAVLQLYRNLEKAIGEGTPLERFDSMACEENITGLRYLDEGSAGLSEIRSVIDMEVQSIVRGSS